MVRTARERAIARRIRRLVPDLVWAEVESLLPPPRPTPRGGRPRADDRAALAGILHVLRTGTSWATLPQELGFGSGMTCWRRLREWQMAGVWTRIEGVLLARLPEAGRLPWHRLVVGAPAAGLFFTRPAPAPPRVRAAAAGRVAVSPERRDR